MQVSAPYPKHAYLKIRALAPRIKCLGIVFPSTGQVAITGLVDYGRGLGLSKKHVALVRNHMERMREDHFP